MKYGVLWKIKKLAQCLWCWFLVAVVAIPAYSVAIKASKDTGDRMLFRAVRLNLKWLKRDMRCCIVRLFARNANEWYDYWREVIKTRKDFMIFCLSELKKKKMTSKTKGA